MCPSGPSWSIGIDHSAAAAGTTGFGVQCPRENAFDSNISAWLLARESARRTRMSLKGGLSSLKPPRRREPRVLGELDIRLPLLDDGQVDPPHDLLILGTEVRLPREERGEARRRILVDEHLDAIRVREARDEVVRVPHVRSRTFGSQRSSIQGPVPTTDSTFFRSPNFSTHSFAMIQVDVDASMSMNQAFGSLSRNLTVYLSTASMFSTESSTGLLGLPLR